MKRRIPNEAHVIYDLLTFMPRKKTDSPSELTPRTTHRSKSTNQNEEEKP